MNIAITFRHLDSSEAIKAYTQEKVGRIQKFLRKPMKASVTLSVEKGEQIVECLLNAGSEHYAARDSSENIYASIDRVCDKLEQQVTAHKGASIAAKRGAKRTADFAVDQAGTDADAAEE